MSDVLLVHTEQPLSDEKRARLTDLFSKVLSDTGLRPVMFEKGVSGEVHRDLTDLVAAIEDQTAAMRELAESNRAVVDLVIAQQAEPEEDQDAAPSTYLDGEPMES